MQFIADESIDFGIIFGLRAKGCEVYSILENSSGIEDQQVLKFSNQKEKLLINEDKDFGEITHRLLVKHNGILLIRLTNLPRKERVSFAIEMIINHYQDLIMNFSVLTENGLRIKKQWY